MKSPGEELESEELSNVSPCNAKLKARFLQAEESAFFHWKGRRHLRKVSIPRSTSGSRTSRASVNMRRVRMAPLR